MNPGWLVGSLVIGCSLATTLTYLGRTPGRHWFDSLLWLGHLAGSLWSRNLRSPSEPVAWMALSTGLAAAAYGVLALVHALW